MNEKLKLSVISVTWNNTEQLIQMVNSMTRIGFFDKGDRELVIVNNGKQPCEKDFASVLAKRTMQILNCAENRGWESGLIEGLKVARGEYVCFQNDDVHIPQSEPFLYDVLMNPFGEDAKCGMVGPITTCAAGMQSIFNQHTPAALTEVKFLIFFCVMMKRLVLDEVGGVDETLPGGDDFDLSIRMRKAGYKLFINPNAFLIHIGFQTGNRVRGTQDIPGGWNSREMQDRTNKALIQKHGFVAWVDAMTGQKVTE
jgi:GT2 family glycosyltransferase